LGEDYEAEAADYGARVKGAIYADYSFVWLQVKRFPRAFLVITRYLKH